MNIELVSQALAERRPLGEAHTGSYEEWQALPKQHLALSSNVDELLYGGSVGAGKSDFLLMDWLYHALRYKQWARGMLVRRHYPDLRELQSRARILYGPHASWGARDKTWTFKNGAALILGHLDKDKDLTHYQGFQFTWQGYDEITDWESGEYFEFLRTRMRSPRAEVPKRRRATGNPGRPGHQWVKDYFVSPTTPGRRFIDPRSRKSRVFIQAYLWDNPYLMQNDDYLDELRALNPILRRAFLWGDWDTFVGQALHQWRRHLHVIRSADIAIDPSWRLWAACDFNTARPYAILYFAAAPNGHIYVFHEDYGQVPDAANDTGTGEGAAIVAKRAWANRPMPHIRDMLIDPKMDDNGGHAKTIAQDFRDAGWRVHHANNDRPSGFSAVKSLLEDTATDGYPVLQVVDCCYHTIRTLPSLPLAITGINAFNDVNTKSEDHLYDCIRYMAMSSIAFAPNNFRNRPSSSALAALDRSTAVWNAFDPRIWTPNGHGRPSPAAVADEAWQRHVTLRRLQGY